MEINLSQNTRLAISKAIKNKDMSAWSWQNKL